MFKELFYPLVKYVSFFNVFQYITFRAAYAAVTALLISFLMGPRVIRRLTQLKLGQEIRHDGPQTHLSKAGTPTMGGVLIIFSVVISVLLWQDLREPYVWILLSAVVGFGGLGFLDDYLKISRKNSDGLRSGVKFWGQILISLGIMLLIYYFRNEHTTQLYIPFLKNPLLDMSWGFIPFGVIYIVGFSNAVNLTDGLDGLASGLVLIVCLAFALLAYASGHSVFAEYLQIPYISGGGEMTVLILALLGAVVGFLWFNCHPAEVMMGDTGSLMIGGVLGVLALILKKELLLIIIGGVFVIETVSVVIQVLWYKRTKKRVFKMAPLHHHFEMLGWAESKVVTRFWILGGMFAILGLSTLKIQ
ncbi:MAG: phospho-N-acetylmuramoyl-pentapeptide-transferase [Spirochaetaceae bacterium]|jgi:phospho-N-acetylmuramoyl-pentapeptide-transferase|nr:phospho-N-acetylmuramoyl-pentapeptide-transferase [Spirochaetaceae bacterium]